MGAQALNTTYYHFQCQRHHIHELLTSIFKINVLCERVVDLVLHQVLQLSTTRNDTATAIVTHAHTQHIAHTQSRGTHCHPGHVADMQWAPHTCGTVMLQYSAVFTTTHATSSCSGVSVKVSPTKLDWDAPGSWPIMQSAYASSTFLNSLHTRPHRTSHGERAGCTSHYGRHRDTHRDSWKNVCPELS